MRNIIMVGMMSSGKTTLGKKLARVLGFQFVDLDKLIEADQQTSISTIFSQKGEDYFRLVEQRMLIETSRRSGIVLASGGGTPCFFDNMQVIKKMGFSIFLDVPAQELVKRIEIHDKDDRPILSGAKSLLATLEQRISERRSFYEQADVTLRGDIDLPKILAVIDQHKKSLT